MIVIGDIQQKKEEPFFTAHSIFLDSLLEKYNTETMVLLGDIFHFSSPHWTVYNQFQSFLEKRKGDTHILDGNHDQSKIKGHSLSSFGSMPNVHIYSEYAEVEIDGHNCLMLPFIYSQMKETYEALEGKYDFIFPHFETSITAFGEGINNTKLEGIYILGHQHMQKDYTDSIGNKHYVVGVPIPERYGEHKQKHRIISINNKKELDFIPVPQYFTYRDVEYGDDILPEWEHDIINIKNAPSMSSVHEKYKNVKIRDAGVTLKEFEEVEGSDEVFVFHENALNTYFDEFSKETKTPVDKCNTIKSYFNIQNKER